MKKDWESIGARKKIEEKEDLHLTKVLKDVA